MLCAALAAVALGHVPAARIGPAPAKVAAEPVTVSKVLSGDDWFNSLRSEQAWQARRSSSGAAPAAASKQPPPQSPGFWGIFGPPGFDPDEMPVPQTRGGTYRTVCVRLCDGYYFPISASTTREQFARDEATCDSRCSSGAKLYVMRADGSADEMVDLRGQPYSKLKTAFLYRTAYDASCKCKPHPWEQEARLQHRVYALEEQRKKGNKQAVAELKEIRKSGALAEADKPDKGKKRTKGGTPSVATATVLPLPPPPVAPPPEELAQRKARGEARMAAAPDKKVMRLGAPPPNAPASGSGNRGDWRARALSTP